MKKLFKIFLGIFLAILVSGNVWGQQTFTYDFESATAWEVDNVLPCTTYDGDGTSTYAFQDWHFTNEYYTGACIVFNNTNNGSNMQSHTGSQFGVMFNPGSSDIAADDWFILPELVVTNNSIFSFWCREVTSQYGAETIHVGIYNSNGSFSSVIASNISINTTTWTEYTYNLSNYANQVIRLAIHCTSLDIFGVMIDDINVSNLKEYCIPSFNSNSDCIVNFTLGDINNSTASSSTNGYGNYTNLTTDILQGSTVTASLTSGAGTGTHAVSIWIDFDNNKEFSNGERIGVYDGISPNTTVYIDLVIPNNANIGSHRLRIVYQYSVVSTNINSCASASYGEGEDYTINIIPLTIILNNDIDQKLNCEKTYYFYDSGGENEQYSNSQDYIATFTSDGIITLVFIFFETESGWDNLTVYDGDNTGIMLLNEYSGNTIPSVLVANSGKMTIVWHSDSSVPKKGWIATITITDCPDTESCEVFTNTDIPTGFDNDETYPWTIIDDNNYHDSYCLKSGNGGINSSTSTISVTATFENGGTISFDAGCWGEGTNYDICIFKIDNIEKFRKGNEQSWSSYEYEVGVGTHTFYWTYQKDGSVNPVGDAFFVDNICIDRNIINDDWFLPISLLSFTASPQPEYNLVQWTTATEKNNDLFILERSEDAVVFDEVYNVSGAGNSLEPIDYKFKDYCPVPDITYYRLTQVDYDGSKTTSEMVSCIRTSEKMSNWNYFTHTTEGLQVNSFDNPVEIYCHDVLGRLIYTYSLPAHSNTIISLNPLFFVTVYENGVPKATEKVFR